MRENSYEYIIEVEFPKIFEAIDTYLKPEQRGFELVYSGLLPGNQPTIMYQSSQCKWRISCSRDRPYDPLEINDAYGRSHAPIDDSIIELNGERHWCWHQLTTSPVLHFLDGLEPKDAVELRYSKTIAAFYDRFDGDSRKEWKTGEHFARREAWTWEHYGDLLFELFDVRHPALWDKYVEYLKEYYTLDSKKTELTRQMFNGGRYQYLYKVY